MARALIVGCGCRGRALGTELISRGWAVRGSSRDEAALAGIEVEGIEAVVADPDRVGSVLEHVQGVTVVLWLLGTATGEEEAAAVHGPRLERMLEKLVDSPVRGFVYEAAGTVDAGVLAGGSRLVREASERWRIPVRLIEADPLQHQRWLAAATAAVEEVIAG